MSSHVVGRKEPPLLNETIGANLRHTVERTPDSPAVISTFQGIQLSYEQFWSEVQRVAAGFAALGMQKGDRLGLWACNSAEWTIVQYSAAEIGLIMVSLNPAYRNYELEYTLERAGVSCLVLGRSFKDQNLVNIAAAVQPEVLSLQTCIVLPEHDVDSRRFEDTTLPDGWLRYEDLQVLGEGSTAVATAHAQANRLRPDEAINIQFTSGTTGRPKAATLSSCNILNNARLLGETLRYTENDRVCIPVPLFHCFGQVMGNLACTTHGAAMCYPFPWFDAAATLRTAASERCTSLYGVPSMFIKQLELLETNKDLIDLSSLRTGVMAGSPCPVEVMRAVRSKMHMEDVSIGFGMTETSPISFQTALDDPERRRIHTVGKVHPHVEAKVVDPATGTIVPRGTPGELFVRGYNVMLGYYGDEKATREAIDADGWMHTGDLATLDDEGYLSIVGRSKDTVIRGGVSLPL
jgi:fatty-acyl-CoA synthase